MYVAMLLRQSGVIVVCFTMNTCAFESILDSNIQLLPEETLDYTLSRTKLTKIA